MADDIPQWAKERACALVQAHTDSLTPSGYLQAFAHYIAAHEEPPVDPLLVEAREIAAGFNGLIGDKVRSGQMDKSDHVCIAVKAIRRGMELGRDEQNA